jgi:hypothetical protein
MTPSIDGVPSTGIEDWLEECFEGVVGYIAELIIEFFFKWKAISDYMYS